MYFKTKMLLSKLIYQINKYYIGKIDGAFYVENSDVVHFYDLLHQIEEVEEQTTSEEDEAFFHEYLNDPDYYSKKVEEVIDRKNDNK